MGILSGVRRAVSIFAIAVVSGCGGGGDSSNGSSGPAAPIANLTGTWSITEAGVSNCANLSTYSIGPYQAGITQNGTSLTVTAPGGTFVGSIQGDKASWSGSYPSGSGRTTITSMALTVASDGNTVSGSAGWTWADSAGSCSGISQSINAQRIAGNGPAPAAPSGLAGTPQSASSVSLVWNDNSFNETGFKIERRASGVANANFAQVAIAAADATSFTDTGLNALTAYEYRVRATNVAGDSGYSNVVTVTTIAPPVPAPQAPSGLALTVNSSSSITLRWNDNSSNETSFRIERSTSADSGFSEIASVGANVATYQDSGVAGATRYFYRVRAANGTGNSAYSNTADATTPPAATAPAAPSNLDAKESAAALRIDLSWRDNSSNETGFKIERSTNSNNGFTQIGTTAAGATTFSDTSGLATNTKYFYRVRATNATTGLDSGYSNTANATTRR